MWKKCVAYVLYGLLLSTIPTFGQPQPRQAAREPAASALPVGPGTTLTAVKTRGRLRCGTSAALSGFGSIDVQGAWSGFDVDFCRAVATAVFGEPSNVDFVPLAARERFSALQQGSVDVLSRDTT